MLSNATNQPNSIVEFGDMEPADLWSTSSDTY